jgi:hypothetical protein
MTYEGFWQHWLEAVNKFTVLQHRVVGMPQQMTRYIHAEADTGSRYEVLGVEAQIDWRNPHHATYEVVVMNPWINAWPLQYGSVVYPDYAIEHWGSPRGRNMHGGDAAALTLMLNMIAGATIEEAAAFARTYAGVELTHGTTENPAV